MSKKPSLDEYTELYLSRFSGSREKAKREYDFNMGTILPSVDSSPIYKDLLKQVRYADSIYIPEQSGLLFAYGKPNDSELLKKDFESAINKAFRVDIIYRNQSKATKDPKDYINASNIYENIDDLIRCRYICKYMDGPRFLCELLQKH